VSSSYGQELKTQKKNSTRGSEHAPGVDNGLTKSGELGEIF